VSKKVWEKERGRQGKGEMMRKKFKFKCKFSKVPKFSGIPMEESL
jgi:hypothetical protein